MEPELGSRSAAFEQEGADRVFVGETNRAVEGQRGRPSGVTRLDLLNVVGSRPAFLASPDGVILARAASRSMAVQIWLCVSMGMDAGTRLWSEG